MEDKRSWNFYRLAPTRGAAFCCFWAGFAFCCLGASLAFFSANFCFFWSFAALKSREEKFWWLEFDVWKIIWRKRFPGLILKSSLDSNGTFWKPQKSPQNLFYSRKTPKKYSLDGLVALSLAYFGFHVSLGQDFSHWSTNNSTSVFCCSAGTFLGSFFFDTLLVLTSKSKKCEIFGLECL